MEGLEARQLLSVSSLNSNDSVPFQKIVIDSNPNAVPLVKILVDVMNSGHEDAVVGHNVSGGLYWYQHPASGNPGDSWIEHTIDSGASVYESARATNISGHVDSNGKPVNDLVVAENGTIVWYENPLGDGLDPAAGPWTRHMIGTIPQGVSHDMYLADLDGNGKLDVVTNTAIFFHTSTGWSQIATANYNRTELGLTLFDSGSGLGSVDLAGTGNSPNFSIGWYENPRDHGGNAVTDPWIFHPIGPAYGNYHSGDGVSYASLDINGDGHADLIVADGEDGDVSNGKEGTTGLQGGLIWWQAPADPINGAWTAHTIDASAEDVHNLVVADINGDGTKEILVFEQEQSPQERLMIDYNEGGTGQNWLVQTIGTGSGHNEDVGDENGDGSLDILNAPHGFYTGSAPISLYLNQDKIDNIAKPSINSPPASATVQTGSSATFSVSAGGTGPLTYQWQRNGLDISGANAASYTINSVSAADDNAVFRCIVGNPAGLIPSAAATLHVSSTATPAAPANVTAAGGTNQITVSWSASTGATGYNVYRGTSSNAESSVPLNPKPITTVAFTDSNTTTGIQYFYKVTAINSNGESGKSSEASATASAPASPAPPAGLQATAGDGTVVLNWNPSPGVTGYNIYRGYTSNGEGATHINASVQTATNFTNRNLVNGRTLYYEVTAVNGNGEGGKSTEVSATPASFTTRPPAPANLKAAAASGQVTLSWDASAGATGYNIYRGTASNGEGASPVNASPISATTFTNSGLTNGTTYYYKVTAINSVGEGLKERGSLCHPGRCALQRLRHRLALHHSRQRRRTG